MDSCNGLLFVLSSSLLEMGIKVHRGVILIFIQILNWALIAIPGNYKFVSSYPECALQRGA